MSDTRDDGGPATIQLPNRVAIWEGSFTLYGVVLRCYVLDDGTRIINADDAHKLLQMPELGELDPHELRRFNDWRAGR